MFENSEEWNEALRLAVQGSADVFWCIDLEDERRNWVSQEGWTLVRRPPEPRGPTLERALSWVHSEDRARVEDALRAQFELSQPINVTFRMVCGDGTVLWLCARAQLEPVARKRLAGSLRDVTAEHAAMTRLEDAVSESRLLLREINHRVKNNLQLIISMLMIQARAFADQGVRDALGALASRIKAIGLVNNHVRQERGGAVIALDSYLDELVAQWRIGFAAPGDTVHGNIELPNASLRIDDAVCLGLVLNELAAGAFKRGRRPEQAMTLLLSAYHAGPRLRFEIEHDGVDTAGQAAGPALESAAATLITLMSDQLGAELVYHRQSDGGKVELSMPASRPESALPA